MVAMIDLLDRNVISKRLAASKAVERKKRAARP
jgi:hypothetical protein